MHAQGFPARNLSWRALCGVCGGKKAQRWSRDRLHLAKYCANPVCRLFGVPSLVSVQRVITTDRRGRLHVRHQEVAVRKRPTFTVDAFAREP